MNLRFAFIILGGAHTAQQSVARETSHLRRTSIGSSQMNFTDHGDPQNEAEMIFNGVNRCGSWEEKNSIHGTSDYEYSGSALASSADGRTVAIGAPYNSDSAIQQGTVRVHKFKEASNSWEQIGSDITGSDRKELLGASLALSANGKIIAIGSTGHDGDLKETGRVKVFRYIWSTDTWEKQGNWIFGSQKWENLGFDVALSSDGHTLAVSSSGPGLKTATTVYSFNEDNERWKQVSDRIEEENGGAVAGGVSISLSNNGQVLAIGNRQSKTKGFDSGHVRIFAPSADSSSWSQLGSTIYGSEGDNLGASISLTGDGLTVAIGGDGFDNNRGSVKVFNFIEIIQDWRRKGPIILGESKGSLAGTSVSISSNGDIVAVGAIGTDRHGDESGYTTLFTYASVGEWVRVGDNINGKKKNDYLGGKVALSDDGSTLIVAAPFSSMEGMYSGLTRIFEFTTSETCSPTISPTSRPTPSPSKEPTRRPTFLPTKLPTRNPTKAPTNLPSPSPTGAPSGIHSESPTDIPSHRPTMFPTRLPSRNPTTTPTNLPSLLPTSVPSEIPSEIPSFSPESSPSFMPSRNPSSEPTRQPSLVPSLDPSTGPSNKFSDAPSASSGPSYRPSPNPSLKPSLQPTDNPSNSPTAVPSVSVHPSQAHSQHPSQSNGPSGILSSSPSVSMSPSVLPSLKPSVSMNPSVVPSSNPTLRPTAEHTVLPSQMPTSAPTVAPTAHPFVSPSVSPSISHIPTRMPTSSPSKNPTSSPTSTYETYNPLWNFMNALFR